MKNNIKKILSNSFAKGVAVIASGTAGAQLLNSLLSPIITRIYTPEEYGVFTVYAAILGMVVIIGSLRYEWGIPIAENDTKAINLLFLSLLVLTFFVGIITFALTFWAEFFLGFISGDLILKYKYLIPLGVFFAGLYNIFTQWALRKKNYTSLSKTKINQSVVQNAIKILMGLLHFGPIGLILGNIFGQSSGTVTLATPLIKESKGFINKVNRRDIIECFKRYIRFPVYSAPSQLLNTAGLQLPVLFIASMYGSVVSGYYALAHTIVNLPMVLIGGAVADVFYGEAATIGRSNPERLKDLTKKLFRKLFIIGLVPLIVLIILGPFLFSLVFGHNWYEAGVYSRIIAFLVFTRFIFTPFGRVFSVFERQKIELILDSFRLILVLGVFWFAKLFSLNAYLTIGLYTLVMSIVYLVTFLLVNKVINDELKKGAISRKLDW
ncbi:lipopolysaccharide biosynthesis protein [Cytobacillus sp. NCCP-133]|uniref:lipopolysaccharide biosynthesis protein n=1 Tax=Cytobacillus sp. NCCP-133 TaxID=766848 RepID=UPI002232958A|nr:oligosaccharide flippase family protein [Cytobacillus sp. NCCP-133]GLB58981.1 polysaccharide biosynthesis protein [Cytobacillus sp. NCCP-133]